jgi:hypothetical protein
MLFENELFSQFSFQQIAALESLRYKKCSRSDDQTSNGNSKGTHHRSQESVHVTPLVAANMYFKEELKFIVYYKTELN